MKRPYLDWAISCSALQGINHQNHGIVGSPWMRSFLNSGPRPQHRLCTTARAKVIIKTRQCGINHILQGSTTLAKDLLKSRWQASDFANWSQSQPSSSWVNHGKAPYVSGWQVLVVPPLTAFCPWGMSIMWPCTSLLVGWEGCPSCITSLNCLLAERDRVTQHGGPLSQSAVRGGGQLHLGTSDSPLPVGWQTRPQHLVVCSFFNFTDFMDITQFHGQCLMSQFPWNHKLSRSLCIWSVYLLDPGHKAGWLWLYPCPFLNLPVGSERLFYPVLQFLYL